MAKNIREELVIFCKDNKIDIFDICKLYSLNNSSPDEDFNKALNFCKCKAMLDSLKED